MAFETYQPRGQKEKKKLPIISLSKTSIVLNNVARELIGVKRIELAYDKEADTIRIKAAEHENGNIIEIKKTKFFSTGFYRAFGITQRGKFEAKYVEGENALYIQL